MSVYFCPHEREGREERVFIFVSNAPLLWVKSENKQQQQQQEQRERERVNTERERESHE